MSFFDSNCSVGRRGIVHAGSFCTVEELVGRMKNYGIAKALVHHAMAREYDPGTGNRMLLEEIRIYPSLIPVWVVMPHYTGEFPRPVEWVEGAIQSGVRAVRIFPSVSDQNFCVEEWNCGEMLRIIEKHKMPLLIDMDQLGWNEMHGLLSRHPGLKVLLTNAGYRIDRNLYRLLELHKNLFLETSGYKVFNGIEEICSRFGAHRLVFGSGMPVFSGAASVSMIHYAQISEKDRRRIFYENLEELLEGVV